MFLQGYLAHQKQPPPRTLQQDYVWGHMVALGGGGVSYERGTPVPHHDEEGGQGRCAGQARVLRK